MGLKDSCITIQELLNREDAISESIKVVNVSYAAVENMYMRSETMQVLVDGKNVIDKLSRQHKLGMYAMIEAYLTETLKQTQAELDTYVITKKIQSSAPRKSI